MKECSGYLMRIPSMPTRGTVAKFASNSWAFRLKEPPVPLADPGYPGLNAMVSLPVQVAEIQNNSDTNANQRYINVCDGWVQPWAIRASGRTFCSQQKGPLSRSTRP